jgi:predicted site-specific integrase-resolvase
MRKHIKFSPRLLPDDRNSAVIGIQLVANMLAISPCTLHLWCKEGKVRPTKTVGSIKKWSLNDIEKLRERLVYKNKI